MALRATKVDESRLVPRTGRDAGRLSMERLVVSQREVWSAVCLHPPVGSGLSTAGFYRTKRHVDPQPYRNMLPVTLKSNLETHPASLLCSDGATTGLVTSAWEAERLQSVSILMRSTWNRRTGSWTETISHTRTRFIPR